MMTAEPHRIVSADPACAGGSRWARPHRAGGRLPRRAAGRRGNVLALMVFTLPALAILAAIAINSAYIQLSRTELMVATDAAARAGGRAFSQFQEPRQARDFARSTAALNRVGGAPLRIRTAPGLREIEFGESTREDASRRFEFTPLNHNDPQVNAIRVNGRRDHGSSSGPIDLIFPILGIHRHYEIRRNSVAMQVDRDISLVLDRSGSMLEGKDYDWPPGTSPLSTEAKEAGVDAGLLRKELVRGGGRPRYEYYLESGVSLDDYYDWAWSEHYDLGPAPTSLWEDLVVAVDAFLGVLEGTAQNEHVSLASYASSASLDTNLIDDYGVIRSTLDSLIPNGATAIGRGMEAGSSALEDVNYSRTYAAKTMVVMTDGIHNSGIDPVTVAQTLRSRYSLTIHTVTFGDGADIPRMREVARLGGGNHYHADDGAQLVEVFEEIANNLPTIVTD